MLSESHQGPTQLSTHPPLCMCLLGIAQSGCDPVAPQNLSVKLHLEVLMVHAHPPPESTPGKANAMMLAAVELLNWFKSGTKQIIRAVAVCDYKLACL